MKSWLIILSFVLVGCGHLEFTPNGHRLLYRSSDGEFSCYTTRCCYPYKEKLMVCTEPTGLNGATLNLVYTPEKDNNK